MKPQSLGGGPVATTTTTARKQTTISAPTSLFDPTSVQMTYFLKFYTMHSSHYTA
jgi:hypothetical protein